MFITTLVGVLLAVTVFTGAGAVPKHDGQEESVQGSKSHIEEIVTNPHEINIRQKREVNISSSVYNAVNATECRVIIKPNCTILLIPENTGANATVCIDGELVSTLAPPELLLFPGPGDLDPFPRLPMTFPGIRIEKQIIPSIVVNKTWFDLQFELRLQIRIPSIVWERPKDKKNEKIKTGEPRVLPDGTTITTTIVNDDEGNKKVIIDTTVLPDGVIVVTTQDLKKNKIKTHTIDPCK